MDKLWCLQFVPIAKSSRTLSMTVNTLQYTSEVCTFRWTFQLSHRNKIHLCKHKQCIKQFTEHFSVVEHTIRESPQSVPSVSCGQLFIESVCYTEAM